MTFIKVMLIYLTVVVSMLDCVKTLKYYILNLLYIILNFQNYFIFLP